MQNIAVNSHFVVATMHAPKASCIFWPLVIARKRNVCEDDVCVGASQRKAQQKHSGSHVQYWY